ncbi:MAG: tyrosine-type recombinase/integrase [Sphingomonas sp.]|nr:tyrosine-type recombinase/integrase [Sphingomonas sp.]MDX3885306.1 tyrosine-type recombinase/integrase [Sphingomonas sp.]
MLYTSQRRSDMVRMGRQHVGGGRIKVVQLKTRAELWIPIHPRLAQAITAVPADHLEFLVTQYGRPFTANGFGNWFRDRCDKAGLKHCSAHGLRKAATRQMVELGLSNQLIKSITGHVTDPEVSHYAEAANQKLRADKAMAALIEWEIANPISGLAKNSDNHLQ